MMDEGTLQLTDVNHSLPFEHVEEPSNDDGHSYWRFSNAESTAEHVDELCAALNPNVSSTMAMRTRTGKHRRFRLGKSQRMIANREKNVRQKRSGLVVSAEREEEEEGRERFSFHWLIVITNHIAEIEQRSCIGRPLFLFFRACRHRFNLSTYPHFPGHYFLCYQTRRAACQNWSLVRRVCADFVRVPWSDAEREWKRREANDGYSLLRREDTWVSLDYDWIEEIRETRVSFFFVLRRSLARNSLFPSTFGIWPVTNDRQKDEEEEEEWLRRSRD